MISWWPTDELFTLINTSVQYLQTWKKHGECACVPECATVRDGQRAMARRSACSCRFFFMFNQIWACFCLCVCVYAFVRARVRIVEVYWRITAWLMPNLKLSKQMARNWVDTRMKNRAALYKHFCCVCSPAVSKDWLQSGSGVLACINKIFSWGLVGHWWTGRGRGDRVRRRHLGRTWRKYFRIREEETKREKSLRGCHCGMKEASVWKEPCGKGGGQGRREG